jgi:hypothetical protein
MVPPVLLIVAVKGMDWSCAEVNVAAALVTVVLVDAGVTVRNFDVSVAGRYETLLDAL